MRRETWLLPSLAAAAVIALAGTAEAARDVYPGRPDARNLNAGSAGWKGSVSSEGLCVPVLLCPAVDNSVPDSGGAGTGGGYLRTSIGSLTGVGATSTGTFTGPKFRYRGVDGRKPDSIELDLLRRSDVSQLLSVAGNSATFSVRLLDASGGADVVAIDGSDLSGADSFTRVPTAEIDPDQMRIGHDYRIEISSRFESGAEVLPGGSVGYDNIALKARTSRGGSGGNGGSGGQDGADGADGADAFGGTIIRTVAVRGKFVVAKVRCERKAAKRKCKSKLQARLSKRGPAVTSTTKARVRAGRTDRVKLRIRGKHRPAVGDAKRLTIKRKTRVAGKVRTTYTRAKVRG